MSTSDPELQATFGELVKSTDARQTNSGEFKGTCPCPNHDDRTASLSLRLTDDKILLNCFAGCDYNTIVRSLNIDNRDLFVKDAEESSAEKKKATGGDSGASGKQSKLKYKEVERYRYELRDGIPMFVVIRQEAFDADGKKHKKFLQAKVSPSGEIQSWKMDGVQLLPYRLPQLREAIKSKQPILLVEGEKDVHSAEKLGFAATTFPRGAKSSGGEKVIDECADWFNGADLLLCPDNDESGKPWMKMIGKRLQTKAERVRWLDLPGIGHKEDLSDWIEKGGSSAKLKGLVDNAMDFVVEQEPEPPKPKSDFYLEPWSALKPTKPDWLVKGILERNTLAAVIGESGSGKSFIVVDIACCIATGTPWHGRDVQQGPVVYLAGEGRSGLIRRIGAWAHHHNANPETLMLSSRAIDLGDNRDQLPKVSAAIREMPTPPALIVIDTLARHSTAAEASNEEMSRFINNLDALKDEFNATVAIIHHVGKDAEKGARGPSAFKAALDHELLAIKAKSVDGLVSDNTGFISLTCTKSKDAEPFAPIGFKLEPVDVLDEQGRPLAEDDGSPVRSCVLNESAAGIEIEAPTQRPLGKNQHAFIEAYEKLRAENPDRKGVSTHKLRDLLGVSSSAWRDLQRSKELNKEFIVNETSVIRVTD